MSDEDFKEAEANLKEEIEAMISGARLDDPGYSDYKVGEHGEYTAYPFLDLRKLISLISILKENSGGKLDPELATRLREWHMLYKGYHNVYNHTTVTSYTLSDQQIYNFYAVKKAMNNTSLNEEL